METTKNNLNSLMEFDHVIEVHEDGTVTEPEKVYAPDVHGAKCDPDGWELLNGWSRQYGYSGPVMHSSELIGGPLAEYILENPGYYVAVICYSEPTDEDDGEDGLEVDGWAVARLDDDVNPFAYGIMRSPDSLSYLLAAVLDDGETLCERCVHNKNNPVHVGGDGDGWRVDGWTHSGEIESLEFCSHCGRCWSGHARQATDEEQADFLAGYVVPGAREVPGIGIEIIEYDDRDVVGEAGGQPAPRPSDFEHRGQHSEVCAVCHPPVPDEVPWPPEVSCDFCGAEGHSFKSCPARDDE